MFAEILSLRRKWWEKIKFHEVNICETVAYLLNEAQSWYMHTPAHEIISGTSFVNFGISDAKAWTPIQLYGVLVTERKEGKVRSEEERKKTRLRFRNERGTGVFASCPYL